MFSVQHVNTVGYIHLFLNPLSMVSQCLYAFGCCKYPFSKSAYKNYALSFLYYPALWAWTYPITCSSCYMCIFGYKVTKWKPETFLRASWLMLTLDIQFCWISWNAPFICLSIKTVLTQNFLCFSLSIKSSIVNEVIRGNFRLLYFFFRNYFTHTKSIKSAKR